MTADQAVRVTHPPGYPRERAYAVRVLLGELLGIPCEAAEGRVDAWEVRCGEASLTVPDGVFRTPESEWLTPPSLDRRDEADLFGTAFLLLTRYEELVVDERDQHDRFPASAALGDLDRPLVDECAEALWAALRSIAPRLERRERRFRVVPSHDVDYPSAGVRLRLSALRRGQLRGASPHDPFDTFDLLMDASERRGLRATFYVLADGTTYSLDEPRIRRLLRRIHTRGHDLGLHGGYTTFRDPAALRQQLERLVAACAAEGIEQSEWGGRQHFLRWENPTTWRAYEEAGLAHDASLGFSARPGFRAGTCHEYPVFDLRGRRELRLRERPLVVMDTPTLDRLGLPEPALVATIDRLREQCRLQRGDFTVLWHNNWLVTGRQRRLFAAALGDGS